MRELHECQAEVFRRSEKRIKERRARRNHILMACIPLVLCLTIFGAFLFPQMDDLKQAPESGNEQYFGAMGTDTMGGVITGSVEVSGNGISSFYSTEEDVLEIMQLINGIVAIPETESDGSDDRDYIADENHSTEQKENQKEKGYTILLKRGDGSSTEYLLLGSLLIDQTTQQEYPVREDTMKDLKNALGIPLD
ncbi:MAG: hypothetical protein IJZ69_09725 [Bacteroidales bacterium]|nr:hypothetical protein [Bacteroidales bacterium]